MGLDEIAKCMLVSLREGQKSSEALALSCGGGSTRMTSPRAIWLAGLGLIDEVGLGVFKLTDVGLAFLKILEAQST